MKGITNIFNRCVNYPSDDELEMPTGVVVESDDSEKRAKVRKIRIDIPFSFGRKETLQKARESLANAARKIASPDHNVKTDPVAGLPQLRVPGKNIIRDLNYWRKHYNDPIVAGAACAEELSNVASLNQDEAVEILFNVAIARVHDDLGCLATLAALFHLMSLHGKYGERFTDWTDQQGPTSQQFKIFQQAGNEALTQDNEEDSWRIAMLTWFSKMCKAVEADDNPGFAMYSGLLIAGFASPDAEWGDHFVKNVVKAFRSDLNQTPTGRAQIHMDVESSSDDEDLLAGPVSQRRGSPIDEVSGEEAGYPEANIKEPYQNIRGGVRAGCFNTWREWLCTYPVALAMKTTTAVVFAGLTSQVGSAGAAAIIVTATAGFAVGFDILLGRRAQEAVIEARNKVLEDGTENIDFPHSRLMSAMRFAARAVPLLIVSGTIEVGLIGSMATGGWSPFHRGERLAKLAAFHYSANFWSRVLRQFFQSFSQTDICSPWEVKRKFADGTVGPISARGQAIKNTARDGFYSVVLAAFTGAGVAASCYVGEHLKWLIDDLDVDPLYIFFLTAPEWFDAAIPQFSEWLCYTIWGGEGGEVPSWAKWLGLPQEREAGTTTDDYTYTLLDVKQKSACVDYEGVQEHVRNQTWMRTISGTFGDIAAQILLTWGRELGIPAHFLIPMGIMVGFSQGVFWGPRARLLDEEIKPGDTAGASGLGQHLAFNARRIGNKKGWEWIPDARGNTPYKEAVKMGLLNRRAHRDASQSLRERRNLHNSAPADEPEDRSGSTLPADTLKADTSSSSEEWNEFVRKNPQFE